MITAALPTSLHRSQAARLSKDRSTSLFVCLIVIGLHTGLSVAPGGNMVVPYALCFIAALGVMSLNPHRVTNRIVGWFLWLTAVLLLLAVITSFVDHQILGHIRSSVQFVYSIFIGYSLYVGLTEMESNSIAEVFFWFSIVLIVGSAMELYAGFRPVSDAFRNFVNTWRDTYSSDTRDILSYGGIRPNFFASEPSLLALTMSLSLSLWFGSLRRLNAARVLGALALFGLALYLVRSPNVAIAPIVCGLLLFSRVESSSRWTNRLRMLLIIAIVGITMLLPALWSYVTWHIPGAPAYLRTASFFERQIAPALITLKALSLFPAFGIGLGAGDMLNNIGRDIFANTGAFAAFPYLMKEEVGRDSGNAFWLYWTHFGILGGLLLIGWLWQFLRILKVPHPFLVLSVATIYWQGFGGLNAPMPWISLFSLATLTRLRVGDTGK